MCFYHNFLLHFSLIRTIARKIQAPFDATTGFVVKLRNMFELYAFYKCSVVLANGKNASMESFVIVIPQINDYDEQMLTHDKITGGSIIFFILLFETKTIPIV